MTQSSDAPSKAMDVPRIDYDRLARSFEDSLVTKLRGNTPAEEFLALWVPDSDPVQGILNMIDAAFEGGQTGLIIELSRATLSEAQRAEFLARAGDVGQVSVSAGADKVEIRIGNLQAFGKSAKSASSPGADALPSPVLGAPPLTADESFIEGIIGTLAARQGAGDDPVEIEISGCPDPATKGRLMARVREYGEVTESPGRLVVSIEPEFRDVAAAPPPFRKVLHAALAASREGTASAGAGEILLEASAQGASLSIAVDTATHFVRQARHSGAQGLARAVFEAYCGVIEGLPIQDASDYSGFRLLHALRDRTRSRPVRGIMRTVNVGQMFDQPIQLARQLRRQYAERTHYSSNANGYDPVPSASWVALPREEMLRRIGDEVAAFERERGLPAGSMPVLNLTKNMPGYYVRVFVGFTPGVDWRIKPSLMLALERRLKDRVEDKLQVYHEEMKDKSQLRRL